MKMEKTIIEKDLKMKEAYIENILMWLVIFTGFVSLLFFVIDYAKIIRVKDNMNALSDYGSRFISTNGTNNLNQMATNLNNIRVNAISPISSGNIVCNPPVTDNAYQVIFTTASSNTSFQFYTNILTSTRAVFNEINSNTITCTLTINLSN